MFLAIALCAVSSVCLFLAGLYLVLRRIKNDHAKVVRSLEGDLISANNKLRDAWKEQREDADLFSTRLLESRGEVVAEYTGRLNKQVATISSLEESLETAEEKNRKLFNQMKSSQVRLGKVAENLAPFLEGFQYDPENCRFVGNPIDFVVFSEEGVHFVEVKSGGAQLTSVQRAIRDQVLAGKVSFEVFRVNGEGTPNE